MIRGDVATDFGTPLRECRAATGLSQGELAERSGLSRRGISDLECGERGSPRPGTVRRLSAALRLDTIQGEALTASIRDATAHAASQQRSRTAPAIDATHRP